MSETQKTWPPWLEPLRPDDAARRRIRREVMSRARPLLAARQRAGTWDVTAGWADVLVPVAAAAAALFAALALNVGDPAPRTTARQAPATIEELVGYEADASPPAVLTRSAEPDMDAVLEAAITYRSAETR